MPLSCTHTYIHTVASPGDTAGGKQATPTTVTISHKQAVDESNALVIELMEEGFDPEMCIEAVRRFGEDDEAVRDYLYSIEEKGDIFQPSAMLYGAGEEEQMQPVEHAAVDRRLYVLHMCSLILVHVYVHVRMCVYSIVEETTIFKDEKAENKYLTLSELGEVLRGLAKALPGKIFYYTHTYVHMYRYLTHIFFLRCC